MKKEEKKDMPKHRSLGDSTEDDGNEGVYPVDSHDLGSVMEETFNPRIP